MLVTDATSAVSESDEGDNVWEGALWFDSREERTVGAVWVNGYYRSGLMPLSFNDANARGFLNELGRAGWLKAFQWGDESAWEKDFKDARRGGLDHLVADGVMFVYFSGHGSRTGLRFDTLQDDFELTYDEAYWGNGLLNWLVADSCQVLNNDDGQAIARWGRAFGGLHTLLGFDTPCHDLPQRGENFARYADGSYWWTGALPLKDALVPGGGDHGGFFHFQCRAHRYAALHRSQQRLPSGRGQLQRRPDCTDALLPLARAKLVRNVHDPLA